MKKIPLIWKIVIAIALGVGLDTLLTNDYQPISDVLNIK